MKALEILIPTYGRPDSAAEAMETCLKSADNRFGVRCNSNGFEPNLEKYRAFDQRLAYDSFEQNKGAIANFAFLLNTTNAKFCMFLSDEDRVASDSISVFLDFLEGLDPDIAVISCSIYDLVEKNYYFLPEGKFETSYFDINMFAALFVVPTYISGMVFRTDRMRELNLEDFTKDTLGNAYLHLNIALYLLRDSKLKFYSPKLVLKGAEVKYGGGGHSHKTKFSCKPTSNLDLNPSVYGPYARVHQFFYQIEKLSGTRDRLENIPYIIAISRNILFFRYAIRSSEKVIIFPDGESLASEICRGLVDSTIKNSGQFSLVAVIFRVALLCPAPLFNPLASALDRLLKIINRFYFRSSIIAKF